MTGMDIAVFFSLSLCLSCLAVAQTIRPQVLTIHLDPVPTPTVQPCHVLSAHRCNGYSLCKVAVVECCHMVVGREHFLSFLTKSSVQVTSVVDLGGCV